MKGLQLVPNHMLVGQGKQADKVSLNDGYIVSISIENLSNSQNRLLYGINESANKVPLDPGDKSRDYRAMDICGVPGYYSGTLYWQFVDMNGAPVTNAADKALIIITTIQPVPKEIPES